MRDRSDTQMMTHRFDREGKEKIMAAYKDSQKDYVDALEEFHIESDATSPNEVVVKYMDFFGCDTQRNDAWECQAFQPAPDQIRGGYPRFGSDEWKEKAKG